MPREVLEKDRCIEILWNVSEKDFGAMSVSTKGHEDVRRKTRLVKGELPLTTVQFTFEYDTNETLYVTITYRVTGKHRIEITELVWENRINNYSAVHWTNKECSGKNVEDLQFQKLFSREFCFANNGDAAIGITYRGKQVVLKGRGGVFCFRLETYTKPEPDFRNWRERWRDNVEVDLSVLRGKTVTAIEFRGNLQRMCFLCEDGTAYEFDGPSYADHLIRVDHIEGDIDALIGSPILRVEIEEEKNRWYSKETRPHIRKRYHFWTEQGKVTFGWQGINGGEFGQELLLWQVMPPGEATEEDV